MGSTRKSHDIAHNDDSVTVENKNKVYNECQFDYAAIQKMRTEQFDDLYKTLPLTDDTTCGLWFFKGELLQK